LYYVIILTYNKQIKARIELITTLLKFKHEHWANLNKNLPTVCDPNNQVALFELFIIYDNYLQAKCNIKEPTGLDAEAIITLCAYPNMPDTINFKLNDVTKLVNEHLGDNCCASY
jgi:hypothetical protein